MPPPQRSAELTRAQWSRPASLLILGVRPNSPQTTTVTSLVQAAGVDVLDQGRDPLVEQRQVLAEPAEVLAVRIPESVGDRDAPRPGLDQSAGDQELVVPHRRAVAQVLGEPMP